MKVTISRLGHPENCILNGGRQTIFPAFLSPNTIRLIRTFEELSFNRLKHEDTFHERLIKVRHLGFKFEQENWGDYLAILELSAQYTQAGTFPTHAWYFSWLCHNL